MKDFRLYDNGDVVISGNDIQYTVNDTELLLQKIRMVLSTNLGEWGLNPDEGIDYGFILVKNPDYDQIISTIQDGIHQVDETLQLKSYEFKHKGRSLYITLVITTQSGEDVTLTTDDLLKPPEYVPDEEPETEDEPEEVLVVNETNAVMSLTTGETLESEIGTITDFQSLDSIEEG